MADHSTQDHLHMLVAVAAAGLSVHEVWLAYFALTGNADLLEVDAYLHGALDLPELDRHLLSHAVEELTLYPD